MREFADLLETTATADPGDDARNLTSLAAVKTALAISGTGSDGLIQALIPRVTALIIDECKLAADAAGRVPTFASETLKATWFVEWGCRDPLLYPSRGRELYLPWRLPVSEIVQVTEDGNVLVAGDDYQLVGAMGGRLLRLTRDVPTPWSSAKIVVTFKAGFATPVSANVDKSLEAGAIEQIKSMLMSADRDPSLRVEHVYDVARLEYAQPGGDTLGALEAPFLLPSVRSMIASWKNPLKWA